MKAHAMKKQAVCTCLLAMLSLTACGTAADTSASEAAASGETISATAAASTANSETDSTESSSASEIATTESKILVVYFSATGTTKEMAEEIAAETGADLFEIVPVDPYTDADLDYNDDSCRANQEQNDPSARPEIADRIENWDAYDTVFIGHPIWWGIEPRIVDTFLESYDFSGKSIAHFCTSGGSGIAASDENLKADCSDANWLGSLRLSDSSEISGWLTELGVLVS